MSYDITQGNWSAQTPITVKNLNDKTASIAVDVLKQETDDKTIIESLLQETGAFARLLEENTEVIQQILELSDGSKFVADALLSTVPGTNKTVLEQLLASDKGRQALINVFTQDSTIITNIISSNVDELSSILVTHDDFEKTLLDSLTDNDVKEALKNIGGVGKETPDGGEIFNDYTGNKAVSPKTSVRGGNNVGGLRGYYWVSMDSANKTLTLSEEQTSVTPNLTLTGWEVGDTIFLRNLSTLYTDTITITAINGNVITVDNIPFDARTPVPDGRDLYSNEYAIWNNEHPDLGAKSFGNFASSDGQYNLANGAYSHTAGVYNKTVGQSSFIAGGSYNNVYGDNSFATGSQNTVSGNLAHAEGDRNTVSGYAAHAEGYHGTASGLGTHTEGGWATASGQYGHAEGYNSQALGARSHAEGTNTVAEGRHAHTEGLGTYAHGGSADVEGAAHAEGINTRATGIASHAEGHSTLAEGDNSHAEGRSTSDLSGRISRVHASGTASHAEGRSTKALSDAAHAEGYFTLSGGYYNKDDNGNYLDADGNITTENLAKTYTDALTAYTHAEGAFTQAAGRNTHAEGEETLAQGNASHAEGSLTKATGAGSHAEGKNTLASGIYSHAEGQNTVASGQCTHAGGRNTVANEDYQTVVGKFNDPRNTYYKAFIVGTGTEGAVKDGFSVDWAGNGKFAGSVVDGQGNNLATTTAGLVGKKDNNFSEYFNMTSNYTDNYGNVLKNQAQGSFSHAEGYNTKTQGTGAHAEGYNTQALGQGSHTEGMGSYNTSTGAINYVKATGTAAHAEGTNTLAQGSYSHAENTACITRAPHSHAEGYHTEVYASANQSHTEGYYTIAGSPSQHVEGEFNIVDAQSEYYHIVGNGLTPGGRSNAYALGRDGSGYFAGQVYVGSGVKGNAAKRLSQVFYGTDVPNNDVGLDGDIYIRYSN